MKKRLTLLIIFTGLSAALFARIGIDINGLASIGYTIVDVEEAAGEIGGTIYQDWSEFYWSFRAQGLYRLNETMLVGGEIGFQNLFWYYAEIPYVPTIYRPWNVIPVNISGVFQYNLSEAMSLQGGAGAYIYGDRMAFGLFSSFTYKWKITDSIYIPAFVRLDAIFALGFTMPVSAGSGIIYKL